jgi:hypothetical protein
LGEATVITHAAKIFADTVAAIWGLQGYAEAAGYLKVRTSTIKDWATGRRDYPPAVLKKLRERMALKAAAIARADAAAAHYLEPTS